MKPSSFRNNAIGTYNIHVEVKHKTHVATHCHLVGAEYEMTVLAPVIKKLSLQSLAFKPMVETE